MPTISPLAPNRPVDVIVEAQQLYRAEQLSRGLNWERVATQIEEGFTPLSCGLSFVHQEPESDDLLTDLAFTGLAGTIQLLFAATTINGGLQQYCVTTSGLYIYDEDNDRWDSAGIALNGSTNIKADWAPVPSQGWVVITNGVDTPFRYDGTNAVTLDSLNTTFTSFTARYVASWQNLLIFLDTTEAGVRRKYRVRRSDVGNPNEWEEGLAGRTDLLDSPEDIVGSRPLGPYLIVYRQRSLVRGSWGGQTSATFDFNTRIQADGPLSAHAITALEDTHFFAGQFGIYMYRGGLEVVQITDKLARNLFVPSGVLERQESRESVNLIADQVRHSIMLFLYNDGTVLRRCIPSSPQGTDIYVAYIPRNFSSEIRWGRRELDYTADVAGTFVPDIGTIQWQDLVGNWDAQTVPWDTWALNSARYGRPAMCRSDRTIGHWQGVGPGAGYWLYHTPTVRSIHKSLGIDGFYLEYVCRPSNAGVNVRLELDGGNDPAKVIEITANGSDSEEPSLLLHREQLSGKQARLVISGESYVRLIEYGYLFSELVRADSTGGT